MSDRVGRCHDCTAPQTEVNMLSRHILELQKDKGELIDRVRELEKENAELKAENEANENGAKKYAEFYFETNDQLTKATVLLKKMANTYGDKEMYDVKAEIKQFLSEVENDSNS